MLPGRHALGPAAVATRSIVMIAISSRSRLDFQGRFRLFRRHAVLPIWSRLRSNRAVPTHGADMRKSFARKAVSADGVFRLPPIILLISAIAGPAVEALPGARGA